MSKFIFPVFTLLSIMITACTSVNVTEKIVDIPQHEWKRNYKAVVDLDVTDSASYQLYLILRHTQQYPYNNILLNITIQDTANYPISTFKVNAPLTTVSGKWAGANIDDLYDHRIRLITSILLKKNRYRFIIEQLMKEDPLPYILNTGIVLEKDTITKY